LVKDRPRIIPVKFDHNSVSDFRKDVKEKMLIHRGQHTTDDDRQTPVEIADRDHNHSVRTSVDLISQ